MTNYAWMEKQLEQYEETLRESAVDRVEERFEKLRDEVEERARKANEHLHGAILDGVVRKALRELRERLEADAEQAVKGRRGAVPGTPAAAGRGRITQAQ